MKNPGDSTATAPGPDKKVNLIPYRQIPVGRQLIPHEHGPGVDHVEHLAFRSGLAHTKPSRVEFRQQIQAKHLDRLSRLTGFHLNSCLENHGGYGSYTGHASQTRHELFIQSRLTA